MRRRLVTLFMLSAVISPAVVIDRIAIAVGNGVIKDSDIELNIRFTSFMNGESLDFSNAARKAAASRLLDQIFIKREVRIGDYPVATLHDADLQLAKLRRERFRTDAAFQSALRRYGLSELDIRVRFQDQLTILSFIDARFKPAAYVSDEEIQNYYNSHTTALRRQYPGKSSLDDLRDDIRDILSGEKVNQLFFAWLDEQRKTNKVRYLEENLG